MKRRIIGSILVIVMLVLSLASCAYSYANEKSLATYAPFTDEQKAAFEAAIAGITIEDGDFTSDPETRAKKVIEKINEEFANAAADGEKITAGVPAANDLVHYCYYASAVDKDGKTYYFYASNMKDSSAKKLQLGKSEYDTKLEEAVAKALATYNFENVYSSATTATTTNENGVSEDVVVKAGDLVFVTYKTTHKDAEGKDVTVTYTNTPVTVKDPAANTPAASFEEYLSGKKNATDIAEAKFTVNGVETTYSGIKINWIANGKMATSFTESLEKSLTTTTTEGSKTFDAGTVVTYYLYPTHFLKVEAFNATNLLNVVLKDGISYDLAIAILFGKDYVGLDEEVEADKEKKAWLDEQVKAYERTDDKGAVVTLKDIVEKLATLQKDLADADTALDKAAEDASKKKDAMDTAQNAVTNAGDNVTDKIQNDLTSATDSYNKAEEARAKAETAYNEAKAARDAKVTEFLGLSADMETKLVNGYKIYTYDSLQYAYNNEIRQNLAKEIYFFINKYVVLSEAGVPEGAIELTYKQLIENHENEFYTGEDDKEQTHYNKYLNKGLFKGYLTDIMNANSYEEACQLVREEAKKINEPLVRIYRLAEVYGVLVSDKAFEDYKNNDESSYYYTYYETTYGENSVRHAYQFDKLINYWLEVNEDTNVKAPADANGYVMETPVFKAISSYKIGTPASEVKE